MSDAVPGGADASVGERLSGARFGERLSGARFGERLLGARFGERLLDAFAGPGRLCVGIDPHASLLRAWDLPDTSDGALAFGLRVVEAAAGSAAIVKPQVAFFERFGAAGVASLETIMSAARDAGILVIADAKRGDIGSTMAAYAEAWLTPGSPLEADALTVSPYLGTGALAPAFELAEQTGKGLFVLAATSNPEAEGLQRADQGGRSVAATIVGELVSRAADHPGRELADAGVVLGATADLRASGIDVDDPTGAVLPVLAPGFGHQGAQVADAPALFGVLTAGLIVSESRGLLAVGPGRLAEAIRRRAEEVRAAL